MGRPLPSDWNEQPTRSQNVRHASIPPPGVADPIPADTDYPSNVRQTSPDRSPDHLRRSFTAERVRETSRRLAGERPDGNGARVPLGVAAVTIGDRRTRATIAETDTGEFVSILDSATGSDSLSHRQGARLFSTIRTPTAHRPLSRLSPQPPAHVSLPESVRSRLTSRLPPPSPRPRHRTTSNPTPSTPPAPATPSLRDYMIPHPPVLSSHSPATSHPTSVSIGPSPAAGPETLATIFSNRSDVSGQERAPLTIIPSEAIVHPRVTDRLASLRERIAAIPSGGRPGEREIVLLNARRALQTAVSFAERLEQATRELTRISDATHPDLTSSDPNSPRNEHHSVSQSLQRSIDQLRAASARIDRVLDQHLAPSIFERIQVSQSHTRGTASPTRDQEEAVLPSTYANFSQEDLSRPASSSPTSSHDSSTTSPTSRPQRSPRTASRSAYRPPLTTVEPGLTPPPGLSPYRPFSIRNSADAQHSSSSGAGPTTFTSQIFHRGSMGLSSGLMGTTSPTRRRMAGSTSNNGTQTLSSAVPPLHVFGLAEGRPEEEGDATEGPQRWAGGQEQPQTRGFLLDRNGDPLKVHRRRELIGR
ncbi:hypothetical protein P7C70_g2133, partial [Phenoliferia sp. Uapishka_3]